MRWFVAVLLILCGSTLVAQATPQCNGLDGLIGEWQADADPASPGVTGWTAFERDVQGKVIVRKNHADYPAMKDKPAYVHDDLMVIYHDGTDQRRAIYWDNEDHVIRYAVTSSSDGCKLTLVTEPGEPGPRFRLLYEQRSPDVVAGVFEIAPPGAEFKKYREWTMRRRPVKTQ